MPGPLVHVAVVVTPALGNREFVFGCLDSLWHAASQGAYRLEGTVVINGPAPELAARLAQRYPGLRLVERAVPGGLAANLNQATAGVEADYLLMANDDVVFLPGSLERAVAFLEDPEHARVACVGFNLRNPDGSLQPSTYSFPTVPRALLDVSGLRGWVPFAPWTAWLARLLGRGEGRSRFWAHDRTLPVDTFKSAAMLVRACAAREVGPLDETTLVGGDETDWHRRMWDRGWSVVFLHDAPVVHYGSRTIRHLPATQAEFVKATLNFFWKHRSRGTYYTYWLLAWPLVGWRMLAYAVAGRWREARILATTAGTLWRWRRGHPSSSAAQAGPAGGQGR